ncbi:hypothetical protein [Sphingopyxis granuli]|uniref:hypothetical protein n=1 Tax=Sphingopyxis granuli TaxID=267128 RepID=UPI001BB0C52D|nr:hypothetical protein [Sphingopyxis granuli]QUM73321.1 hypothetical protein ICN83_05395 [Sphingopyxis granuli]
MHHPIFVQAVRLPPTYGVGDIVRRLGQEQSGTRPRSLAWQLAYIRDLIAQARFPQPLPLPVRDRATGTRSLSADVHRASRWPRALVDQWFDDLLPPGTSGDAAEQRAGEAIMDERARQLGLHLIDGGAA